MSAVQVDHDHLPRWQHLAACHGRTEMFFSSHPFSQALAVRICSQCPVRQPCEVDVRRTEHPTTRHGVAAGLTPDERRKRWG